MNSARYPLGKATSAREGLAIAIALSALGVLGFGLTSPILPDLREALEVSDAAVGLIQGAVALPGIVMAVLIGSFADRYGRRRVAVLSLLVFGGFGGACFWARSLWLLIGFRFLQGLGMSGILGFGIVLVGDYFRGPGRTRAMGANQTGMMVGAMSGPVLSGVLATGGAFRPFLVYFVAIPLALWAARLPAEPPGTAATPLSHLRNTIDLLRRQSALRDYVGLMIVTVAVISVGIGMGLTVVPLFLDAEFGLSVTWRGVIVAAFQGGTALAAASIAFFRGRLRVATGITVGLLALGVGYALMSAAPNPATVAGGLLCAGLGFGVFIPLAQTYVSSVGGSAARGMTVGMWMSANRVAQTGAPSVAAGLADRAGHRVALLLGSGVLLALAALWHPIRRRANLVPHD